MNNNDTKNGSIFECFSDCFSFFHKLVNSDDGVNNSVTLDVASVPAEITSPTTTNSHAGGNDELNNGWISIEIPSCIGVANPSALTFSPEHPNLGGEFVHVDWRDVHPSREPIQQIESPQNNSSLRHRH